MQEGSLRADVNISVKKFNESYGTRCEVKNLNSIKFIKQAINYEAKRQINIIESGGEIEQNTLLFNTKTGKTKPMRSKEEAHDYRYFPDPDLLPLELTNSFIEEIKKDIPELPDQRKSRYIENYKLSSYDALIITSEKEISNYFDEVINSDLELAKHSKILVNWITSELFALLKKENVEIKNSPINPINLGRLIKLITTEKISGKIAKEVFEEMFETSKSPDIIVEEKGLAQVSDSKEIERIIDKIIDKNKGKVLEYKKGKTKLLGYFVGETMKLSKGKANPKILNEILRKKLRLD